MKRIIDELLMIIIRCRNCMKERECGIYSPDDIMKLEMEICQDCRTKYSEGKIRIKKSYMEYYNVTK